MEKLILIVLILLGWSSLFGQFEICNSNTDKTLNDIYFLDENIGVAVGDSGVLIRSKDGGINWDQIMDIDSISFKKVKFWDDDHGITIGTQIFTTSNGGLSWKHQDISNVEYIYDVELFSDYEFIVSVSNSEFINNGSENKIIRLQLIDDDINVLAEEIIDYKITQMSFINDSVGFAHHFYGSEVSSVLQSTNGGIDWNKLDFEVGNDFTLIEDISFISDKIGFMGGWYNAHLMKTIDGGLNWNTVNIENSANTIFDIPQVIDFHINSDQSYNFYSCGWHGEIFKSEDLGDNWRKIESPIGSGISMKGIYFINDDIGWAVGEYGTIIKTANGGELTTMNNLLLNNINIYPNPFDSFIEIDLPIGSFDHIKLYSLTGKILKISDQNYLKDLNEISSGFYMLSIESGGSVQTYKLLKK